MGRVAVFFLFLFSLETHAVSFQNYFQNDVLEIEKILLESSFSYSDFNTLSPSDKFSTLIDDPMDRINDNFTVHPYFETKVRFWFNIYAMYSSNYVVIHDKSNLKIIYEVINFSDLDKSIQNKFTKSALQVQFVLDHTKDLKTALINLSKGLSPGDLEKKIITTLKIAGKEIPKSKKARKKFYLALKDNIRAQTGQRDNIRNGLINIKPFYPTIKKIIREFNLPEELLAISFLESSFNIYAVSKVGATGVWQFMEFIGKAFMTVNKDQDGRRNPLISTVSAMHLLKQNKQILKSWDLAVAAYNSGTKHFVKARRLFKRKKLDLPFMLKNYRHPHIGFAAKNFYGEFLALVYLLSYQDLLFEKEELISTNKKKNLNIKKDNINFYITLCNLKPDKYFRLLKKSSPDAKALNRHIVKTKKTYKRGLALVSDIKLNKKKYLKIPFDQLPKYYPKKWYKLAKNHKCSRR